ncbi:aromatic amino acid lyase [Naasia lichenicola]|uniref:aromatic amino acid lyase n=1 Tax=Naasia lichenicola TaxID=2565933 RepID=UPI00130E2635|nr:aromatic amino acid lyase [Naasia lichenicola]
MTDAVVVGDARLTLEHVVAVAALGAEVALSDSARTRISAARAVVEAHLAAETPVYGLNRELGAGRNVVVDDVVSFQLRVLRNHDAGIGELLTGEQVRASVFTRVAGFSWGGAGVRPEWATAWIALLNAGIVPAVRRVGSVGAADLTTLAAIARVVAGEGSVLADGDLVPAADALADAGVLPVLPAASEALASLSSNAYSVGVGALAAARAERLPALADLVTALTIEAVAGQSDGGSLRPFDPAVNGLRPAQAASAARIRTWLTAGRAASRVSASVQDAVSIRSAPQINAALADRVAALRAEIELLLNASTENPLVAGDAMAPNGNFQITALAVEFDALRVAIAHVAVASERRSVVLSALQRPHRRSGASRVPGLLLYTASSLVAELRHLADPVSLTGGSLSEGVEDVSSSAALALQLLERSISLAESALAIEGVLAAELIALSDPQPADALDSILGQLDRLRTGAPEADALVRDSLAALLAASQVALEA